MTLIPIVQMILLTQFYLHLPTGMQIIYRDVIFKNYILRNSLWLREKAMLGSILVECNAEEIILCEC